MTRRVCSLLVSLLATPLLCTCEPQQIFVAEVLPCTPPVLRPRALDPTVSQPFHASVAFLYERSNELDPAPVQAGVQKGTIRPSRSSLVRGVLLDQDGEPLLCVKVSVLGRKEYGETLSRAGGLFDLVVNGDEQLTLHFDRSGYLPAQRRLPIMPQRLNAMPDVVLLRKDRAPAQRVDFTTLRGAAVVKGAAVTDRDGTRQVVMLLPEGIKPKLRLASGEVEAKQLTFRAIEYTQGARGVAAMPGTLPPQSGYTYAVELMADEVEEQKALSVALGRKVPVYLDNFLKNPVGTAIPSGYYDPRLGEWVASDNGRVIRLLEVKDGEVRIDTNNDGRAEPLATLDALGIVKAERQQLAALYPDLPKDLWRVEIDHLTPWDFNHNWGPPLKAMPPPPDISPSTYTVDRSTCSSPPPPGFPTNVLCKSQVLDLVIPISATDQYLHFRNDRARGFLAAQSLRVPLTGSLPPDPLLRIELEITTNKQLMKSFLKDQIIPDLVEPNAAVWDGFDPFGQGVQQTKALIKLIYVYQGAYYLTPEDQNAAHAKWFGGYHYDIDQRGSMTETQRAEYAMQRIYSVDLTAQGTPQDQDLAGFNVESHHRYSSDPPRVLRGDGTIKDVQASLPYLMETWVGTGAPGSKDGPVQSNMDGSKGGASLSYPTALLHDSNGCLFITERSGVMADDKLGHRVRKLCLGQVENWMGAGEIGYLGNPDPVGSARVGGPVAIVSDANDNVYVASERLNRVRSWRSDPQLTLKPVFTLAGDASNLDTTEVRRPTSLPLFAPWGLALRPYQDGQKTNQTLYVTEQGKDRIRSIDFPLDPVEKNPDQWTLNNRDIAMKVVPAPGLSAPRGLAYAPGDKWLYVADSGNHRVVRISLSDPQNPGSPVLVAGTGTAGYADGKGQAAQAQLSTPSALALSPDERFLLIADTGNHLVRRVNVLSGTIENLAGKIQNGAPVQGSGCPSGVNRLATELPLSSPMGVTFGAGSAIFIADTGGHCVRRLAVAPGLGVTDPDNPGERVVLDDDRMQLYVFNAEGRHVRTTDVQRNTLLTFSYDAVQPKLLGAISNPQGVILSILRDGDGNPLSIERPGQSPISIVTDAEKRLTALDDKGAKMMPETARSYQIYGYPPKSGLPRRVDLTNKDGSTTLTMEYDARGLLTSVAKGPKDLNLAREVSITLKP